MSSVCVVVFGYNLNQAVDMHGYLKVNVHSSELYYGSGMHVVC